MENFKFFGLDYTLIDQMYFPKMANKVEYINKVEEVLRNLSIAAGDDRLAVINKIADANIDLPLIVDVLAFTGDLQYSKYSERGKYYTNCKLCEYNIQRKLETAIINLKSEELLLERLSVIELAGYSRLNLTFQIGQAFAQLNLIDKRDHYFNLLSTISFDISQTTVSNFYRAIAQTYLESGDKENALSWLKAGILLNPKLSVKKLIKELEGN